MTLLEQIQQRIATELAIPEKDSAKIYTSHGIDAAVRRKVWQDVLKLVEKENEEWKRRNLNETHSPVA